MTKTEFKTRWESDDSGGGITTEDIANCAVAWGISEKPKLQRLDMIIYKVLKAAGISNAEEYLEGWDG